MVSVCFHFLPVNFSPLPYSTPKSVSKGRIEQNADIFDFELSDEDMAAINALDHNHRLGFDPMLV
jgi:diketogulonate reductase-like aldo/keto reductase